MTDCRCGPFDQSHPYIYGFYDRNGFMDFLFLFTGKRKKGHRVTGTSKEGNCLYAAEGKMDN